MRNRIVLVDRSASPGDEVAKQQHEVMNFSRVDLEEHTHAIIENHSGKIQVKSQLGKGSILTLELPVEPMKNPRTGEANDSR